MLRRRRILGLTVLLGAVAFWRAEPAPAAEGGSRDAPVSEVAGAEPADGYVDSRACRPCHLGLWESYQQVGMARSFFRPDPRRDIEDLAAGPWRHEPSGDVYEMLRRDGQLVFRRWQDDHGSPTTAARGPRPVAEAASGPEAGRRNLIELPVAWVLGSGHKSRTYLYRTPNGELFQLPIAWYTEEGRWAMAPGFDRAQHLGLQRGVRRECMFCHNAYPEVPPGADAYGLPAIYPEELPEGTGCQRCHGPGARHIALANDGRASAAEIRGVIVNPGKLAPGLRDDVCNQCHLQPVVALSRIRRLGRRDFSYRPGTPLADFLVQIDVQQGREDDPDAVEVDRFEINHAPYRLRQSKCWTESEGRLSCLTCHDPHRRVAPEERVAHFRRACLSCHQEEECTVPPAAGEYAAAVHGGPGSNCVGCHMPRRRTEDVVHVVMTDHRITRRPGGPELLAPRSEREPILLDAWLLEPESVGSDADLYRTLAVARTGASPDALRHLERLLAGRPDAPYEALLDLATGWLDRGEPDLARAALARLGRVAPPGLDVRPMLAVAEARLGRLDTGRTLLVDSLGDNPRQPAALANLARLELARDPGLAQAAALTALDQRPNLVHARRFLAQAARDAGDRAASEVALRDALRWEPREGRLYLELASLLATADESDGAAAADRTEEALALLRHGLAVAFDPSPLRDALARLEPAAASAAANRGRGAPEAD